MIMKNCIRPTPERLDCLFALWDEDARKYRLKTKAKWTEGLCWALRCRHEWWGVGWFCCKCRKRISRLNNPIADRVNLIKVRAKRRGQAFNLTAFDLELVLLKTGMWEKFMMAPDFFHVDRKDCLHGYTPDNIKVVPPEVNREKVHREKLKHRESRLKLANGELPGLEASTEDPF